MTRLSRAGIPVAGPSKNTKTWQMYEQLFFLDENRYPFFVRALERGKAINLAMGLNRCNVKHFQSMGAPDSAIQLSAKAKEETDGTWYVEISQNFRRAGINSPSRALRDKDKGWMDGLMQRIEQETLGTVPAPRTGLSPAQAATPEALPIPPTSVYTTPEVDPQEEMINKMYGIGD